MKNKTGIIAGVILVVLIIIITLSSKNKEEKIAMQKDAEADATLAVNDKAMAEKEAVNDKDVMMEKDKAPVVAGDGMMKSGSYEAYSSEKIAMKASLGNVVLFFRASWCPTCRALDKDIKENLKNIPSDLTILDVDYDNSSELKKKYGVTYQHTMVEVDKDGKLIKKWMGSPTLESFIKEVI